MAATHGTHEEPTLRVVQVELVAQGLDVAARLEHVLHARHTTAAHGGRSLRKSRRNHPLVACLEDTGGTAKKQTARPAARREGDRGENETGESEAIYNIQQTKYHLTNKQRKDQ